MQTFLILGKFTGQGIKNVKETTRRAARFEEIAADHGIRVKKMNWLMGEYDVMNIVESQDAESVFALMLELGAWGNVTTTTFRAYHKEEMNAVVDRIGGMD